MEVVVDDLHTSTDRSRNRTHWYTCVADNQVHLQSHRPGCHGHSPTHQSTCERPHYHTSTDRSRDRTHWYSCGHHRHKIPLIRSRTARPSSLSSTRWHCNTYRSRIRDIHWFRGRVSPHYPEPKGCAPNSMERCSSRRSCRR